MFLQGEAGASGKTLRGMFSSSGFEVDSYELDRAVDNLVSQYAGDDLSKICILATGGFSRVYDELPVARGVVNLRMLLEPVVYKAIIEGTLDAAEREMAVQKEIAEKTSKMRPDGKPVVPRLLGVTYIPTKEHAFDFLAAIIGAQMDGHILEELKQAQRSIESGGKLAVEEKEMTLDEYVSGFEGTAIPVIKMEKLDGIALNQYLHDNRDNTKFDFRQKTKLSRAIAEALSLFHSAGYIHRDVKPDNIFVKEDGGDYSVRFVDCGLVTKLSRLPASKEFSGSIRYMPLEHIYAADPQRRNWAVARRETDIFSLGAVMHKIFEGESPVDYAMTQARRNYDAAHRGNPSWDRNKRDIAELGAVAESLRSEDYLETLRFMVEEVTDDYLNTPEGMIDLVMYRCLQKDINMRYSKCEDVVMELEYALRLLDEREKNDVARQLMPEKPPLESGLYIIRDDKVVRVDGPEIPYSVKAPRTVLRAV